MRAKKKTLKNHIIELIYIVLVTLFLLSVGTIFIVNFRPLYYFDISYLNIENTSGMSRNEIIENYNVLIDYNSPFYEGELEFPTLSSSSNALEHFKEVKDIFRNFYIVAVITGILIIPVYIYASKQDKSCMFLRNSSIFSSLIPIILAIVIGMNFDKVFILFHELLFNNNYWIFSPDTDPIITILPDTYFLHCAIGILIVVIIGSIFQYLFYHHKKKVSSDLKL